MKSATKLMCLALCLMLLIPLAACGTTTAPAGTEQAQATDNAETTAPKEPGEPTDDQKDLKQYTDVMKVDCAFYVGTAQPADPVNNPTVAYIRDNLKIDISGAIFLSGADAMEKLGLMVASRDMPDVVNWWTTPQGNDMVNQFANSGMLLEIEPYFQYLSHITPNYTDLMLDVYRNPADKKLYCVPSFSVNPDNKAVNYTIEPNLVLVVRRDLMDQMGTQLPVTMDDFYNLLVKFKEQPTVDGKAFIPLQPLMGFGDFEQLIGAGFGIWTHRKDMNDAESRMVDYHETPEYLEFLKYAAKLYREGLVDPEMFVTTWEKTYERVVEGRVGIYVEWPNNIDVNTAAVRNNIPAAGYEGIAVPRKPGLGSTQHWHTTTLGACTTIVNKDFSDPVRLMKFLDWMFTTEGWATVAWGAPSKEEGPWYIENDQYFWNPDVYAAKVKENPSYGAQWGGWVYFMVGQLVYLPEHIGLQCEGGTDPDRLLAKERNIGEVWMDQEYELWQAIPMGPVATEKSTAITSIFTTQTQQIVMECKSDEEVTQRYNAMIEEAKNAGLKEMLQEKYQQIKALGTK